jgi:shikimate kinase
MILLMCQRNRQHRFVVLASAPLADLISSPTCGRSIKMSMVCYVLMANCVVLLGCWTAGKTSTVKRMSQFDLSHVELIDSDEEVSQQYGRWLGNIFLAHPHNPTAAHKYFALRERLLLAQLLTRARPFILAAGPLLPTRDPLWQVFITQVRPTCFHISLTAEEVYAGLKKRRAWQTEIGLDLCEGYGAWDEGLLTEFDIATKKWIELDRKTALLQITHTMSGLERLYHRFVAPQHIISSVELKTSPRARQQFLGRISQCLSGESREYPSNHVIAESCPGVI